MEQIDWNDFEKVEMRIGTILEASVFEKARKPSYKMKIDFGDYGVLKSSAQITDLYSADDLVGRQIIAVCNFPKKQIADFMSECLVMGVIGGDSGVVLIAPERTVPNGARLA